MAWELVAEGVHAFHDSCVVYAVQCPSGHVIVNTGTGRALDHLGEIGAVPNQVTVLLTHAFRDHCDGARLFHAAGAEIMANYWDAELYVDPEQHFRERAAWNSYDNRWDRFAPIRPVSVGGWLMDYETRDIRGQAWSVIPTPGPTYGAASYATTVGGRRVVFSGEVFSGDGKVGRIAPLQYDYNDLLGGIGVYLDTFPIMEEHPDLILPSLGKVVDSPAEAVERLRRRLRAFARISGGSVDRMMQEPDDGISPVGEGIGIETPRVFISLNSVAITHFIRSKSGKTLAIDYGYPTARLATRPAVQHSSTRRPGLHSRSGLREHFGSERIDTVLVSHYHDDHVNGIPMLQRLYGTRVIAGENFADILERPARYDRPCLWHEPIANVEHAPLGEQFFWEDIAITLHPMSGHTRFSTLICLEVDGIRYAHTGDQVFWCGEAGIHHTSGAHLFTNHVYKNGLDIGCYRATSRQLAEFAPRIVLSGHAIPYISTPEFYADLDQGARDFDSFHADLMELGESDVHFGPESQPAKLKPYRALSRCGEPIEFEGWVVNPLPGPASATLTLAAPEGWTSEAVEIELGRREKAEFRIALTPAPGACVRRQAIGLDLVVGGRPFGLVTEALVTVGCAAF